MIDKRIIDEYLTLVDFNVLDPSKYELVEIKDTDKQKFSEIENRNIE